MNKTYLRQLLLSNKLLITAEGYTSAMMECFPLISADRPLPGAFFFNENPPTYQELSKKALSKLLKSIETHAEAQGINITDDFSSEELPEGSIAYHRIWGIVTSSSCWYFSSKQFEQDLIAAESNPAIATHFLHINTPGGEAWYLDRLSETISSLKKPIEVLIERCCASAGYYIACHGTRINALTQNDSIGCIGTMTDYWDFSSYYESLGVKHITAKSNYSDLKNKKYEDLRAGNKEQYISEELDPLAEQFISEVKRSRTKLTETDPPEDNPIFRGETFDATHSVTNGLIDNILTLPQAISEAYRLGQEYLDNEELKQRALSYV